MDDFFSEKQLVLDPGNKGKIINFNYIEDFIDKVYYTIATQHLTDILRGMCYVKDYSNFLAGDIKEEYELSGFDDNKESIIEIKNFILEHIREITPNVDDINFNLWINKMKKHEYNPTHIHDGDISFVWYLKVPQKIREEHIHQRKTKKSATRGLIQFNSIRDNDHMTFNPKENDILFFNSAQKHQVYPFYTDDERISVAGNIKLIWN